MITLLPLTIFTDTTSVRTTIHINSEDQLIIEETIGSIEQRLAYAGYAPEIAKDSMTNIFTIIASLDTTSRIDSTTYYSQFENNTLEFEFALRQDDKIIRSLYEDVVAVAGLIIPEDYDPAAIFLSRDPELLDEQEAALTEIINGLAEPKYEPLKFVWSAKPKRIRQSNAEPIIAHILYAYNLDQSHDLTESDIGSVDVRRTDYGDDIFIDFKNSAAGIWDDMTLSASNDDARQIAMILNDEVIYSPKVRSIISNGKCVISGNFNRTEANDIANKIRIGRFPVDVTMK